LKLIDGNFSTGKINLTEMKKTILIFRVNILLLIVTLIISCENQEVAPGDDDNAVFLSFSSNRQTLPTSINGVDHRVVLEVDHDVDVTRLIPEFDIPDGYSVYVNGIQQISGSSIVDFSQPVLYTLKDKNNRSTTWQTSVVPLACKILIDASHDGGVWWFTQYEGTGFNANEWHQGQVFANLLREKGFEVNELGRGEELTEEMFFGHYIVIRVNGFQPYTMREREVYTNLINRGMKMVFFTDHKKFDPIDELGDHLGLKFEGSANGVVTTFMPHPITENMVSINYVAGAVLTNANENTSVEVLGWLGEDDFADLNFNGIKDANEPVSMPVMGILNYPNSRIFFIGDTNGIETQPPPFIDNLIGWMGTCFER